MSSPRFVDFDESPQLLIQQLESALHDRTDRLVHLDKEDDWFTPPQLYAPLIEDLLDRVRRAEQTSELRFLARQAAGVLQLRSTDLPTAQPEPAAGTLVLQLAAAPLRRRLASLGELIARPDCHDALTRVLAARVASRQASAHDLLLRALARVLLYGWGAREIIPASLPGRGRPAWDLYSPDLGIVVQARPHRVRMPSTNLARHLLIVTLKTEREPQLIEARLYSGSPRTPTLWTGLQWDEEQRLRAADNSGRSRAPETPGVRQLRRSLASLERRLSQLVGATRVTAPWAWRPGPRRRGSRMQR